MARRDPGRGQASRRGARARGLERGRFEATSEPLVERLALDVLARVRASPEPLDRVLTRVGRNARLGPRERRQLADLAFSHARTRARAEALIDEALKTHGGVPPPRRDRDRAALALAALAHDLSPPTLNPLPEPLAGLVADACELGFGALASGPPALPAWLAARLQRAYGDDAEALAHALQQQAPVVLAFDPRRTDAETVIAALAALDVTGTPSPHAETALRCDRRFALGRLPASVREAVWPMDDGSQAVVHALAPRDGEIVLDLCAGGGGKTKLLEALGARPIAADVDAARLAAAHKRVQVPGVLADGRAPPFALGAASAVLVDAPCTGTGTLRRAPDLATRLHEDEVEAYADRQRALLAAALPLLAPGGRLVYATCSLLPEENEEVVRAVIGEHEDIAVEEERMLLPSRDGTDGFFICRLVRAAG